LERAVALRPEHISCYCLTVERGTPLAEAVAQGKTLMPDEDAQAEMQVAAFTTLTAAGYLRYEISNYALPGRECLHNRRYWKAEDYLGLGPGAASHLAGVRWVNSTRFPLRTSDSEALTQGHRLRERVYLALRTSEGVPLDVVKRALGSRANAFFARWRPFVQLARDGYNGGTVTLSARGFLLADAIGADVLA